MCQAYEGERDYILAHEKYVRECGYEAQKLGKPITSCPLRSKWDAEDAKHWEIGWRIADENRPLW